MHINIRELQAVGHIRQAFLPFLHAHHVQLLLDNMVTPGLHSFTQRQYTFGTGASDKESHYMLSIFWALGTPLQTRSAVHFTTTTSVSSMTPLSAPSSNGGARCNGTALQPRPTTSFSSSAPGALPDPALREMHSSSPGHWASDIPSHPSHSSQGPTQSALGLSSPHPHSFLLALPILVHRLPSPLCLLSNLPSLFSVSPHTSKRSDPTPQ